MVVEVYNKAWLDLTGLGLPRAKLGLDWALRVSALWALWALFFGSLALSPLLEN